LPHATEKPEGDETPPPGKPLRRKNCSGRLISSMTAAEPIDLDLCKFEEDIYGENVAA